MAQFEAKMIFLCILQVSRFVFVLKTNFHNYFTVFNLLWTGPQFLVSSRVSAQDNLDSGNSGQWTAGLLLNCPRTLMQSAQAKEVQSDLGRWIRTPRSRLDYHSSETVRHDDHRI